jgi:selenide,water dikinase
VDLSEIVRDFALAAGDPHLIVGFDTGDDAGVYGITDDLALVQTLDYITPVVDDPYLFGQVAAANALSDVYAMGGRPLTAMNICNFPAKGIDKADLRRILEGGWSKIREAGATLVGGHTVRDEELKYGLSVTGLIDPRRVVTNAGARPGDRLVLTKPIGTGAIVTALRRGIAPEDLVTRAVGWMTTLNRVACETMLEFETHACTDITGFGLAGHAMTMARASRVLLRIRPGQVPRYPEALEFLAQGLTTAMAATTYDSIERATRFPAGMSDAERRLVVDPQTSGGLLIVLPERHAAELVRRLRERGLTESAEIGEVAEAPAGEAGLEFLN